MLAPVLTARSFRAIGTTATVVVPEPADADGRRAPARDRARRHRPRLQQVPRRLGAAGGARRGRPDGDRERAPLRSAVGGVRDGRADRRRRRPHHRQCHRRARLRRRPGRGAVPSSRSAAGPGARGGLPARAAQPAPAHRPHPARCPSRPRCVRQGAGRRSCRVPHRRPPRGGHPRQPGRRRRRGGPRPGRWVADRHRPRVVHPGRPGRPGGGDHPRRPGQLGHLGQDLEGGRP